jgi:osmotically-inducible protein OsmY
MKRILLLLCLAGAVGCATPQPPADQTLGARPPLDSDQMRSDESISSEVRRRLSSEGPELSSVVAVVKDGIVTLSGTVTSVRAAWRAEAAARAVAGVTHVQNSLSIHSATY